MCGCEGMGKFINLTKGFCLKMMCEKKKLVFCMKCVNLDFSKFVMSKIWALEGKLENWEFIIWVIKCFLIASFRMCF